MKLLVALLFLASSSACATRSVSLKEGPRQYVASDYEYVLKRWTRTESLVLYDELERALTVTATFHSWDFRWAYTIRYARDFRLTIPQRQSRLQSSLESSRKNHEFFVALYGAEQEKNDLTDKDSAWGVRLIDASGNEVAPSSIERIRNLNVLERRYYPYASAWRKAFRIQFPVASRDGRPTISPRAKWFGLRFAGAWGNTDLVWTRKLEPLQTARSTANERANRPGHR